MSKQSYWEKFYRKKHPDPSAPESFDWFFPYQVAKPWLLQHIQQQQALQRENDPNDVAPLQVLELGCGTSDVAAELFVDDPTLHVQCVDFSEEAIKTMHARFKHLESTRGEERSGLHYSQCDITSLPFADGRFHVCYEKGAIDAILKEKTVRLGTNKAVEVICEVARKIHKEGVFLQFSDDLPERRLPILEKAKVEIEKAWGRHYCVSFKDIGNFSGIDFFMYVMKHESLH